MKANLNVLTETKEYPEMTFAEIQKMVELMNQGISEQEAREEAMKHD